MTEAHRNRLANIIGWLRTAKENLPAINEGIVSTDRVAQASALLDRMYGQAVALQSQVAIETDRKAA